MELSYILIVMMDTELHALVNSHISALKLKKKTHTHIYMHVHIYTLSLSQQMRMSALALCFFFLWLFCGLILLLHMVSSMGWRNSRCITHRYRFISTHFRHFTEKGTLLVSKYMHIKSQERTLLAHSESREYPLANHFDQTEGMLFLETIFSFLWPGK